MALLDDLSYETLFSIFGSLCCVDLASVSRVSRRWHVISEPILYRAPYLPCPTAAWTKSTTIELFLRTLLGPGCERLASHVRVLEINWGDMAIDPRRAGIIAMIAAASLSRGITGGCVPRSQSAHVLFLMHLLPRLQVLVLVYGGYNASNDVMAALAPSAPVPLAFQMLTSFSYDAPCLSTGLSPTLLLFLLQQPRMRTLCLNVVVELDNYFPADVRGTSGVTKLTLGYCTVTALSIALILSVPRALEEFTYHGDCVEGFMDILPPLRPSLTYLHLVFLDDGDPLQTLYLREWPLLSTLKCSWTPMIGDQIGGRADGRAMVEALPAPIRQLEILDDTLLQGKAVERAVEMLERKRSMVPGLEKLAMYVRTPVLLQRLRAACQAAGITLEKHSGLW